MVSDKTNHKAFRGYKTLLRKTEKPLEKFLIFIIYQNFKKLRHKDFGGKKPQC